MIKIPASGERIGALFVNPGGPGASAVDAVAGMGYALAGSPINEHFDLVGFDPRGVGYSTPEARCRTDAEFDAWRRNPMVDYSPAGVAAIEQIYRNYTAECADKLGTAFLASVGTDSAAKDMDTIRQVLGDDKINYLGFSYGTQLGTEYVRSLPRPGAHDGASTAPWTPPRTPSTRSSSRWPASRRRSPTTPPTVRSRPAARWEPIRRSGSTGSTNSSTRWWPGRAPRRIRAG